MIVWYYQPFKSGEPNRYVVACVRYIHETRVDITYAKHATGPKYGDVIQFDSWEEANDFAGKLNRGR